eukprot:6917899-Karenia_brevis.AAC.1
MDSAPSHVTSPSAWEETMTFVMPSLGLCTGQLTPLEHQSKNRRKSANFGHLRWRGYPGGALGGN